MKINNEPTCTMWEQTTGCSGDGPIEPLNNKSCAATITDGMSGYCKCETNGVQHNVPFDCAPNERHPTTCNTACGVPAIPTTPQKDAATMYPPGIMTSGIPIHQGDNASPGVAPTPYRLISLAAAVTGKYVTLAAEADKEVYASIWTPNESEQTGTNYANNLWRNIQISWQPVRFLVQHLSTGLFLQAHPQTSTLHIAIFTPNEPGMFIFGTNWGDRGFFFCSPGQAYWCGNQDNNILGNLPQTLTQTYAPISPVMQKCGGKKNQYDDTWPIGGIPYLRIGPSTNKTGHYAVSLAAPSKLANYMSTRQNDQENDWYMLMQYGMQESSVAPVTHGWSLAALLHRNPLNDYNAPFNISRTALVPRFTEPKTQTNPAQSDKPKVCIAFNCASVDYLLQGSQQFNAFNFKFWQYADSVIYDGGDQGFAPPELIHLNGDGGEGSPTYTGPLYNFLDGSRPGAGTRVWIPPPAFINTAHANGVRCYGYIGFQEIYYGGKVSWWMQFLEDPIAMAHALVDACIYYGHDGFFINYESNNFENSPPFTYTNVGNPELETAAFYNNPVEDVNKNYLYDTADYWCHYDPHGIGGDWIPGCANAPCSRCIKTEIPHRVEINKTMRNKLIILLKEFNVYRKQNNYIDASIIWYEAMAPTGEINYYGGINSNNLDMWVDADGIVADYMFTMIPGGGLYPDQQQSTYNQSSESANGDSTNNYGWPLNTGPANTSGKCLQGENCLCTTDNCKQSPYAKTLPPDRPYDFYATVKLGDQKSDNRVTPSPFENSKNFNWAPSLYMGNQQGNNADSATIPPLTSLGIYDGTGMFNPENSQEFYDLKEQLIYVSSTGWCGENDNSPYDGNKSKGFSHYITERSVINRLPFFTCFSTGNGKEMWIHGKLQPNYGSWSTFQQDILPTWRWWPVQKNTAVRPSISYATAYNGGSSLLFEAPSNARATDFLLYKTNLDTTHGLTLTVVFLCKQGDQSYLNIGYSLLSQVQISSPTVKQSLGLAAQNGWNTVVINIPPQQDAVAIIWVSTDITTSLGFQTYLGKIAVTVTGAKSNVKPLSKIRVKNVKIATHTGISSANLEWDAPTGGVDHYNVYVNDNYAGQVSGGGDLVRPQSLHIPVMFNVQNIRIGTTRFKVEQITTSGDIHSIQTTLLPLASSAYNTAGLVVFYIGGIGILAVFIGWLATLKSKPNGVNIALIVTLCVSIVCILTGVLLMTLPPILVTTIPLQLQPTSAGPLFVNTGNGVPAAATRFSVVAAGNTPELVEARRVVAEEAQRMKDLVLALPPTAVTRQLAEVIYNTYTNTMLTLTTQPSRDRTFVLTGAWDRAPPRNDNDSLMGGMWLRDSCAAFHSYIPLAAKGNLSLQLVIEGHIRQCADFILQDSYANAFNEYPNYTDSWKQGHNGYVTTRNYEPDSLCYFLWQAHRYWKATGRTAHFDELFKIAADKIVVQFTIEQYRRKFQETDAETCTTMGGSGVTEPCTVQSVYRFNELANGSVGSFVANLDWEGAGMTWTAFRPSDNQALYGFNIPNNMFAVEALRGLQEILTTVPQYAIDLKAQQIASNAYATQGSIDRSLVKHAMYNYPGIGTIYAFEVDAMAQQYFTADGISKEFTIANTEEPSLINGKYTDPRTQLRSTPGGLRRKDCGAAKDLNNGVPSCNSGIPVGDGTTLDLAGGTLYVEVLIDGAPQSFDNYTTTAKSVIFNNPPPQGSIVNVRGNFNLMDDANVPSLLSIPYLGYHGAAWDPVVYANTRKFCLSDRNRWYYGGEGYPSVLGYAGIGSNHTFLSAGPGMIWPMALAAQGLTTTDLTEKRGLMRQLLGSMVVELYLKNADKTDLRNLRAPNFMHESFNLQDPNFYSRGWFGWANALFAEFFQNNESIIQTIIPDTPMPIAQN